MRSWVISLSRFSRVTVGGGLGAWVGGIFSGEMMMALLDGRDEFAFDAF